MQTVKNIPIILKAEGLITGRTATTLAPQGTATRAEVATILMRFLNKYKG